MIHDLMLRWVVTGLFVLTAAECGLAIIAKRRPWTLIVNHGLHFAMAVAMAVMAWPWGARVPTTGPAVFFLLAAVWFGATAVVAVRGTATRGLYGYHGLMMLATAWMYAAMNPRLLPVRSCTEYATEPDGSMPAMDMTAMNMPPNSGSPIWFSAVNCGRLRGCGGFLGMQVCHGAAAGGDPVQVAGQHRPSDDGGRYGDVVLRHAVSGLRQFAACVSEPQGNSE